jgi:hypothetical protein
VKLTIESTDLTPVINGVPVRLWKGTTEQGHPLVVAVHMVMAGDAADPELAAGLQGVASPYAEGFDETVPDVVSRCMSLGAPAEGLHSPLGPLDRLRLLQAAGLIAAHYGLVDAARRCLDQARELAAVAMGPGPGRDG